LRNLFLRGALVMCSAVLTSSPSMAQGAGVCAPGTLCNKEPDPKTSFPGDPSKDPFTPGDCADLPGHVVSLVRDPETGKIVKAVCIPTNKCPLFHNPFISDPDCTSFPITTPVSVDPNDKTGPAGVGTARFLGGGVPLQYNIQFENLATATAPAQQVVITDKLDPSVVDLSTLSLGPISFGDRTVTPPPRISDYGVAVDLRPTKSVVVSIGVHLDQGSGLLTWHFTSIDPDTLQIPLDPAVGFLPPNTTPPRGQGDVTFSVGSKPGLTTGTKIQNQATIVFDLNAAIPTPNWVNTIDNTPPVTRVQALPAIETSPTFTLQWSGGDQGSGILDYTIFVSKNHGPFVPFVSNTTVLSASFTGNVGSTYAFYSVARDLVGNVESKSAADTTTQITLSGTLEPSVTLQPLSQTVVGGSLVNFTANAGGAPAPTVQWQVSKDGGATFTNIGGANAPTLTFVALVAQNGNHYRAVFTNAVGTATSTAAKLTVNPLPGDVNGDGVVSCADMAVVKASFGKKLGQPGFDPRADINGDGVVNILDLSLVARQLPAGSTCP